MRYLGIITIDNTEDWAVAPEDWVVAPAPGAPLKGVHAYLSRWGLAQPKPRTLHSQAAEQPRTNRKEADL